MIPCKIRSPFLRTIFSNNHSTLGTRSPFSSQMTTVSDVPYHKWSTERLVQKVKALEADIRTLQISHGLRPKGHDLISSERKPDIDHSRYTTRKIALKFAYLGSNYCGFEHSVNNVTVLPAIEEVMWKALMKGRLIFPDDHNLTENDAVNWEGCDYSKCGRTDKGVSAFGQVIGLRVRSNRPKPKGHRQLSDDKVNHIDEDPSASASEPTSSDDFPSELSGDEDSNAEAEFHYIDNEISYPHVLNRLLPPDIRVIAWCPDTPSDFSARFSCRERRYRYFFTQPAFSPLRTEDGADLNLASEGNAGEKRREGWLDIESMKIAAKKFEGLHDFRNFCKIDPTKQIKDFRRRIYHSDVRELDASQAPGAHVYSPAFSEFRPSVSSAPPSQTNDDPVIPTPPPKIYVFELNGSAFLWHQVRHMVAILFLVGQGLEAPSLIPQLLDAETNPNRPVYNMAEDKPLVLWDCIFPADDSEGEGDSLPWVYATNRNTEAKVGGKNMVDDIWALWRQRKIEEVLAGSLLNLVASSEENLGRLATPAPDNEGPKQDSQRLFYGGDSARAAGRYVPVMQRKRADTPDAVNARYALRKGLTPRQADPTIDYDTHRLEKRRDHMPSIE